MIVNKVITLDYIAFFGYNNYLLKMRDFIRKHDLLDNYDKDCKIEYKVEFLMIKTKEK